MRRAVPSLFLVMLSACELVGPSDEPLTFRKLSVGHQMTCGITIDGQAFCWGMDGVLGTGDGRERHRPRAVATDRRFIDISTGGAHTCGLSTDSLLFCWGRDYTSTILATPTQRSTIKFRSINVGGYEVSVCGVTSAGSGYCMGQNERGQAGVGHTAPVLSMSPVQTGAVISQLEASYHGCLLSSTGAIQCWGYAGEGALGRADTALTCDPVPSCYFPQPTTVPTGALAFASLSVGGANTCALTTAGAAWCWGSNIDGEVGAPANDMCFGVAPCNTRPVAVTGGLTFRTIVTRWGRTCGITPAGKAYCWGANTEGELGTGDRDGRLTPTAVVGGHEFVQVDLGTRHTCGLTPAGEAWCWGNNVAGSLGIGEWESGPHTRPQRVRGP